MNNLLIGYELGDVQDFVDRAIERGDELGKLLLAHSIYKRAIEFECIECYVYKLEDFHNYIVLDSLSHPNSLQEMQEAVNEQMEQINLKSVGVPHYRSLERRGKKRRW